MRKIIFLITDGYQNPTKNKATGKEYDPVATSKRMYDAGVKIFVVGIGTDLQKQNLVEIARDKSRVYYAETIKKLISDEFVKSVAKKLCKAAVLRKLLIS